MLLVTTIAAVRSRRRELARHGRTVAFVPTMGALHEGHLALVRRARELADEAWASVFVNPTQFGPGEDLEAYPRDLERDRALLEGGGAALLFAPSVKEMYGRPTASHIALPELASGLCGAHRPGHFDGVALVVLKLLNITQPEVAVFGAKDWQQVTIVRRLVEDLDLPVRIEVVGTVREADGIALSSRNRYLDREARRRATVLSRALSAAAGVAREGERSGRVLERVIAREVAAGEGVRLQYAAAVDPDSLAPLDTVADRVLLAAAAYVGTTRLIDNLLVEVG